MISIEGFTGACRGKTAGTGSPARRWKEPEVNLLGEWNWHRWQLMRLDREAESLTVDVIELPADATLEHGALVTLSFRGAEAGGSAGLRDKLATWMEHNDGECDCFYRAAEPFGCLALFQRNDSMIVATMDLPG